MENDILKNNKLIAEFMGFKKYPIRNKSDGYYIEFYRGQGFPGNTCIANLRFHSSWNWIMPVVEKIGVLHGTGEVYHKGLINNITIYATLKDFYRGVISFINWYNKQN
jgi:hypothetical protein